jgi:hypothetical protein
MFDDPFNGFAGIFFYLMGLTWIDEGRRNRKDWGFKAIILPLALWFLYENSRLLSSPDIYDRIIGYAAVFCLASPLIGYILFGRQGRVRKALTKVIGFVIFGSALTLLLTTLVFDDQLIPAAAMAGFALAALAFIPYKRLIEKAKQRQRDKRYRRKQLEYERERRAREAAQAADQAREEDIIRNLVEKLRR